MHLLLLVADWRILCEQVAGFAVVGDPFLVEAHWSDGHSSRNPSALHFDKRWDRQRFGGR
jgi:hypothetical protein